MLSKSIRQLLFAISILVFIILTGITGYLLIENMSLLDSIYMTIISITTTGFAEIKPLSKPGRIFTIFLIITGVVTIAYAGGKAAQIVIETHIFRRRRMSKKLENIGNHYIVCGYGRMGQSICEGLRDWNEQFVVVENDQDKIDRLIEIGFLFVNGDATNDEALLRAGIERAKGLVAVIKTDAENVFATLSAKELNPSVFVVARAVDEGTESKLMKAGADRVVKPYELGGNRMVQLLLRPNVMDFIDVVAHSEKGVDIALEEINVHSSSKLNGATLAESPIRKDLNIMIIAIVKEDGNFLYNPKSSTVIEEGNKLIAIGENDNLARLTELCLGRN